MRKFKHLIFVIILGILANTVSSQNLYIRDGEPWGQNYVVDALNTVFGAGTWQAIDYATASSDVGGYLAANDFIYLSGADPNYNQFMTFWNTYQADFEDWVNSGGNLVLHYASQGASYSLGFGDVYAQYYGSPIATTAVPIHELFSGTSQPADATNWTGNSITHNSFTGTGLIPILLDNNGVADFAELQYGLGVVIFHGFTGTGFSGPAPQCQNLINNIIEYVANYNAGILWTGAVDTDWHNAGNWEGGVVPTSIDGAIIPTVPTGNASNFPVISGSDAFCKVIVVQTGASVTVNSGFALNVSKSFKNQSSNYTGDGDIILSSTNNTALSGLASNVIVDCPGICKFSDFTSVVNLEVVTGTINFSNASLQISNSYTGLSDIFISNMFSTLYWEIDGNIPSSISELYSLSLDNSGIELENDLTIYENLNLYNGNLTIGANSLTLGGSYYAENGMLISSIESDFVLEDYGYYAVKKIISYIKKDVNPESPYGKKLNSQGGYNTFRYVPVYEENAKADAPQIELGEMEFNSFTNNRIDGALFSGNLTVNFLNNYKGTIDASGNSIIVQDDLLNYGDITNCNLIFYGADNSNLKSYLFENDVVGLTEPTPGTTAFTQEYTTEGGYLIEVTDEFTLNTVTLYSTGDDILNVQVWDYDWNATIYDVDIPITTGENTITLDFTIPAGSYWIYWFNDSGNDDILYEYDNNESESYYPVNMGTCAVISTDLWENDYDWYGFYNWQYTFNAETNFAGLEEPTNPSSVYWSDYYYEGGYKIEVTDEFILNSVKLYSIEEDILFVEIWDETWTTEFYSNQFDIVEGEQRIVLDATIPAGIYWIYWYNDSGNNNIYYEYDDNEAVSYFPQNLGTCAVITTDYWDYDFEWMSFYDWEFTYAAETNFACLTDPTEIVPIYINEYDSDGGFLIEVTEEFVLNSVKLFANQSDLLYVEIWDYDWNNTFYEETFNISEGENILNLDAIVPVGTYWIYWYTEDNSPVLTEYNDNEMIAYYPLNIGSVATLVDSYWEWEYAWLGFYDFEYTLEKTGSSEYNSIVNMKDNSVLNFENPQTVVEGFGQVSGTISGNAVIYYPDAVLIYSGTADQIATEYEWPLTDGPSALVLQNAGNIYSSLTRRLSLGIDFELGNLVLTDAFVTFGEFAAAVGTPSENSMVTGNENSFVIKEFSTDAEFTFPVGSINIEDEAFYTPAKVTLSGGTYGDGSTTTFGIVGCRTINQKHSENLSESNYLNRFWHLGTFDISNYSANLEFTYAPEDLVGYYQWMQSAMLEENAENWLTGGAVSDNLLTFTTTNIGEEEGSYFTGITETLFSLDFNVDNSFNNEAVENALIEVTDGEVTVQNLTNSFGEANFRIPERELTYTVQGECAELFEGATSLGADVILDVTIDPSVFDATINVTDGTNPIEGATVTVEGLTPQTTDVDGNVIFTLITDTYNYTVDAGGFVSETSSFDVECADYSGTVELVAVGVNNISDNVSIYPNPSSGSFTIDAQNIKYVTITDLTGKIIYFSNSVELNKQIDLSAYGKGVYLIEIKTANQTNNSKIIIE